MQVNEVKGLIREEMIAGGEALLYSGGRLFPATRCSACWEAGLCVNEFASVHQSLQPRLACLQSLKSLW